jgi:MauM/NapG family ferredoxin protein
MFHDDQRPLNRRRFFREGLRELLKPLAQSLETVAEAANQFSELEKPAPKPRPPEPWLRPPGALPEQQFKETCSKCGECQRVCPAQCIQIDYSGYQGEGFPYIDVNYMPCVLCDGLLCMQNCPSGALVPTAREEIDMGTAVWHEDLCLRRQGQECTICVDRCPMGAAAIKLNDMGQVEVIEDGCTGCGVCQHDCPTYPKSITVVPRSALLGNEPRSNTD